MSAMPNTIDLLGDVRQVHFVSFRRGIDDFQIAWQEKSVVAFKALSDAELDAYLATRQWQGCSGAYAIQESGDPFVRVVEGSISNVIGLPMETLRRVLEALAKAVV